MIEKIFTWDRCDQGDTMAFIHYDVVLKVPIGDYPVGSKFSDADVNYETGEITFYQYEVLPPGKKLAPGQGACIQSYVALKVKVELQVGEVTPVKAPTELKTKMVDA